MSTTTKVIIAAAAAAGAVVTGLLFFTANGCLIRKKCVDKLRSCKGPCHTAPTQQQTA